MPKIFQIFKKPGLQQGAVEVLVTKINRAFQRECIKSIDTEICFYIQSRLNDLSTEDYMKLTWILSTPFHINRLYHESQFKDGDFVVEIGPRLNFSTAFSTNAVSMCRSMGLRHITRIEASVLYHMTFISDIKPSLTQENIIVTLLHDRMTQCRYKEPIKTFDLDVKPEPVFEVDVKGQGRAALEKANKDLGLAFDDWDLDYYTKLFLERIKRNPTSVECFDLAQSNSEHSRHWFFKGRLVVDGKEHPKSLFDMIMATQAYSNDNNVIKFNDNSSAIRGHTTRVLIPENPTAPSKMVIHPDVTHHIIFTAETHNFPTGVAPFPGAATGTGGRIRDIHSTGQGAQVLAGLAGYSFGNLNIPGYTLPWEDAEYPYPGNFASPLEIAVEASNGASDYGNKFGEPVIAGFARSFGLTLSSRKRYEYVKPIMFSAGIGTIDSIHIKKQISEKGMEVVKLGGPVYRIGVGGGAASSVEVQGDNKANLDFGAVQRGDAEMEQKLNRLIRACVELRERNPICSIHDQGAGGNGNVLKEIVEPAGAVIRADDFQLGDPTLSILELWGAEYQESDAILLQPKDSSLLKTIGQRERCPVCFVGSVTGNGKIQLEDFSDKVYENGTRKKVARRETVLPVDLDLEHVLASMPRKTFKMVRHVPDLLPLSLPENLQIRDALDRVLRLPSVASKRYLTNKVDRSVTGLIAQQQCVGPLHTPLADVAVTAISYFDTVGSATAIGEQPIKGLVNPAAGARMSVAEALTNLVFARVTNLKDVKCSGNWMWPAKLPGEGAALLDACRAMCDVMKQLGIAVDGGKDSLSMAARVGDDTVKAPGTLVISAYVGCPDITATVTPDLKCPNGSGTLLHVNFGNGYRLGGSALAQCYKQIGDDAPDLNNVDVLKNGFAITQSLLTDRKITAGHDISDGGLITCLLEMAFAGNCGFEVDIAERFHSKVTDIEILFAEEAGLVLEVRQEDANAICEMYNSRLVPCYKLGFSVHSDEVTLTIEGNEVICDSVSCLRDIWEETSFQLARRQTNPHCVEQEEVGLKHRKSPPYSLTFDPSDNITLALKIEKKPSVAVLREEGSNGDRELAAAFHMAGFEVWDINMQDLCSGKITLDGFRGLAFAGGFSYADVLGSAKGWAATALFNNTAQTQLSRFQARTDTFSLGVCNGCQLMALLGWVGSIKSDDELDRQGLLLEHNTSERFESRFTTVKILQSPAMMLKGMEDTVFGMWVSHGEGKMVFKNLEIHNNIINANLAPVRYVDDDARVTCTYPLNPNGSPDGIAAVCSQDGRHLAIMPHPERCFLGWQCPWMPYEWREEKKPSPWCRMFQNAYVWCAKS
ncbi:phosphoribosylformylglycinamidine synthase-like [Gigantopelta aegis]|uniref:phosphoribosylformylglycinamidine synthase-like n=1 Tax=Gigantopelta aegis TaxID=1735272 RepID=UPI001B88B251|nr:phosphoribosylformylglycinamidine synthase-like [Gigantopelta aegis]